MLIAIYNYVIDHIAGLASATHTVTHAAAQRTAWIQQLRADTGQLIQVSIRSIHDLKINCAAEEWSYIRGYVLLSECTKR